MISAGRSAVGHPVDVATGAVYSSEQEAFVRGRVPLQWERAYSTSLLALPASALGRGWTSSYFATLARQQDGYLFLTPEGTTELFGDSDDSVASGGVVRNLGTFQELRRDQGRLVVTRWDVHTGEIRSFAFIPTDEHGPWPLASVEDATGSGLDLGRDDAGRLVTIRQRLEGRELRLRYGIADRIVGVELQPSSGPRSLIVSYEYDAHGLLSAARNSLGLANRYEYDAAGRLTREVLRDGGVFSFAYDARGRCIRTTGLDRFDEKTLRYHDAAHWTEVTDSHGQVRRFAWNDLGQVGTEVSPRGAITRTEYDDEGRIVSKIGPLGSVTRYEFDAEGNRSAETDAAGATIRYRFNGRRQIISETDELGNTWTRHYDESGHLVGDEDPLGNRWVYSRDGLGRLIGVTDPMGSERRLRYNESSEVIGETDFQGNETTFSYDRGGLLTRNIDPLGQETTFEYDALGQLIRLRYADGSSESFSYDAGGNQTSVTDPNGHVTRRRYGSCARLLELVNPAGASQRFEWDTEPGRAVAMYNEKGEMYRVEYDPDGYISREVGFDGRTLEFIHDLAGYCTGVTDGSGHVTRFERDALGRLLRVRYPDGSTVESTYDAAGNLVSAVNPDTAIFVERDLFGAVVVEQNGAFQVQSEHDVLGNRTRRRTSSGGDIALAYDPNCNLTRIDVRDQPVASFERDPLGRETRRTYSGGVEVRSEYDSQSRLVRRQLGTIRIDGSTRTLLVREYAYDPAGNLVQADDTKRGRVSFSYDSCDRVTRVVHADGAVETFMYDAAGNIVVAERARTNSQSGGATATRNEREYGPGNRLLRDGGTLYAYSEKGEVVKRIDVRAGKEEVWEFEWDGAEQLKRVTRPDGVHVAYLYDAIGRRTEERGPQRRRWNWDDHTVCEEIGKSTVEFLLDEDDVAPLLRIGGADVLAFLNDHIGTPQDLLRLSGEIQWTGAYAAWGDILAGGEPRVDQPVRFPGQWADRATGLHYNRFRYYDPATGRYLSQDPLRLEVGANFYAYGVNPIVWTDPFGLGPSNDSGAAGEAALDRLHPGGLTGGAATFPARGSDRRVDRWYPNEGPNGTAREAKAGRMSLSPFIKSEVRRDAALLRSGKVGKVEWHFFKSPVTGKIGPTPRLLKELKKAGITVVLHPRSKTDKKGCP